MCKLCNDEFTFNVSDGNVPVITVNNKKLYVVTCSYSYDTNTDQNHSEPTAIFSGYLEGDLIIKVYKAQFNPNLLFTIG